MTIDNALVDTLRAEGDGEPLFLAHAMGGTTGCYKPLVAHLPAGRPVYAFKAPRPGQPLHPLTSVEAMAGAYAGAAAEIVGDGPLHLAGWSMGGLVALEMARAIRARGAGLGAVVLIDTWMRREQLAADWSPAHRRVLDQRRWRVFFKLVTGAIGVLEDDDHPFWGWNEADRIAFVRAAGRTQSPERYAGPDGDARFQADHDFYMILRGASDGYRPTSWDGTATWIGGEAGDDRESAAMWRELISGCRVVMKPGDHLSIVEGPEVAGLAEALDEAMTEVRPAAG